MATFNVTADDIGSLINAILDANNNSEEDTIIVPAGTYDVSAYTGSRPDADFKGSSGLTNGLPVIKTKITISGDDDETTFITRDGSGFFRLFFVEPDGFLILNDLTLRKGDVGTADAGGGAILNAGQLVIRRCFFGPDNQSNYGGAIQNWGGVAEIYDSIVRGNQADHGGGLYNGGSAIPSFLSVQNTEIDTNSSAEGGGIFNNHMLFVSGCNIHDNQAIYGGGIGSFDGKVSVVHSLVTGNFANGGGLYNRLGVIKVYDNEIDGNQVGTGKEVLNDDSSTTVDARGNWWGQATGPAAGDVGGLVDTSSYKTSSTDVVSLTFEYNREAAAAEAIRLTTKNFKPYVSGVEGFPQDHDDVADVVGRIEINGVRDYSQSLNHVTGGGTGSAIFVSECVFAGGMPMTVRPGVDPSNANCDSTDTDNATGGYQQRGWRYCPNQQSATLTWKLHEGILAYFTSGVGIGGSVLSSITRDDVVDVIYLDDSVGIPGHLRSSEPTYAAAVADLLEKLHTTDLNTLQAGDYVFLDSSPTHGCVVVGWGPLLGMQVGIVYARLHQLGLTPNLAYTDPGTDDVIPYVADFCFGTDGTTDDNTDWLQDPRPRPFYSARVHAVGASYLLSDQIGLLRKVSSQDAYQMFGGNTWQFHKLPDTVAIPTDRIYYP